MLNLLTVEAALAVSAFSITVNRGSVTRGLRDWMKTRSRPVADLLNCPYCLSHWGAAVVAVTLTHDPLDWFLTAGAIVGMSALLIGASYKLLHWDEIELSRLRQEVRDLETQAAADAVIMRGLLAPKV